MMERQIRNIIQQTFFHYVTKNMKYPNEKLNTRSNNFFLVLKRAKKHRKNAISKMANVQF